jgi:hypothetical protein
VILASNNIQSHLNLPDDTVIRINLAWVPTVEAADAILQQNKGRVVFLDYPQGRSKPPTPSLSLEAAYKLCQVNPHVRYFAVSNIEDVQNIRDIQTHLPDGVEFVPKIETFDGVSNLPNIIYDCGIRYLMLDKEDLYLDVGKDNQKFYKCVNLVRGVCRGFDVNLLELEGVIFLTGDKKPASPNRKENAQ